MIILSFVENAIYLVNMITEFLFKKLIKLEENTNKVIEYKLSYCPFSK